ncbi:(E)-4-hydroxy-3-methylbut-2-enyl-diphosphate synthase, partial [Flavobacteriales bacterium]|nr:(E)-4-hydroxy-3-methylbut-2-enyl-diphosphate synthase [Flavobacteriales bacterium]
MKYCNSLANYSRFKTREVKVGNIGIGGSNPIRIQSMTTSNTMDTIATVEESIRMIDAGCELVRITAPSKKEALNLKNIKEELAKRGYNTPIIADIHYTPNAAEIAATIIEKVRVNPGNYADKKKFDYLEYTEVTYNAEIERIREKFTPLIRICKENGTAMRIGTNHGSLSDRILSRYGDTPKGMVESAMEFLRICRDEDYHEIILSMKASNTRVMVQAYRLLVAEMIKEGMDYPLHLGVTEAGEGEDGRIKSAVGIGALLADGIGDTIRVSLTEAPEFEIPVAQNLLKHFEGIEEHDSIEKITKNPLHSFDYKRRKTNEILNIGGGNVPIVMADFCLKEKITAASFFALGSNYSVPLDKWNLTDMAADYVFVGNHDLDFEVPGTLGVIYNYKKWVEHKKGYPFLTINDYLDEEEISEKLNIVYVCLSDLCEELIAKLKIDTTAVLMIDTYNENGLAEQRKLFTELMNNGIQTPVIIGRAYGDLSEEQLQLSASSDLGALLLDGLGDGIFITAENCGSYQSINSLAFGILQASRTRISKT